MRKLCKQEIAEWLKFQQDTEKMLMWYQGFKYRCPKELKVKVITK